MSGGQSLWLALSLLMATLTILYGIRGDDQRLFECLMFLLGTLFFFAVTYRRKE